MNGLCGTCSVVAPSILGLQQRQIPSRGDLAQSNKFLLPTRGRSDEVSILHLKKLISWEEVPLTFRPRSRLRWPAESANAWSEIRKKLEAGVLPVDVSLPLPMGSTLEISKRGVCSISTQWRGPNVILPNEPPLLDIARQLEDTERVRGVKYWEKLIMALSACVRPLGRGQVPNGAWFTKNGWNGLVPSNNHGWNLFARPSEPPVFHYLTLLFEEYDPEEDFPGDFLRENLDAFQWLGHSGSEWLCVFEGSEESRMLMYNSDVHPRLVNIDSKLHILVLRGGKPTPIPVPYDSELLAKLVTIVLQPCTSFAHILLESLFWNFDSELEEWTPSQADIRGLRLLRSMVEGLGDRSSTEPISLDHMNRFGLYVKGDSNTGLSYCISPSRMYGKFNVGVGLRREDLRGGFESQEICIDLRNPHECVPADHALSYLLALANDSSSRERITTLDALMTCTELTIDRVPEGETPSARWNFVKYCFAHDGVDTEFEDYQDMVNAITNETWDVVPPNFFEEPPEGFVREVL